MFVFLPLLLGLALAVGLIGGSYFGGSRLESHGAGSRGMSYNKLQDILRYIEGEYVDSVDAEELTEEAILALLAELDPHSAYISAEEFSAVNDPLLGSFEGIGVQFNMQQDTILVLHVIAGGPSEKAGLRDGDRILRVDGEEVAGRSLSTLDVMRRLKGDKGTRVEVEVLRRGVGQLIPFTIIRDVIPTYSIDISFMPEEGLGYIRLSRFSMTTAEEFDRALNQLNEQGMDKLILDLRGNSGGYLDAAIALADEFLQDDQLIVYTQGRSRPKRFAYSTQDGDFEDRPLVLLIDEGSASASEILAGAVQDNDRGIIVGRRSFGKGLVQEQLQLPDGSALRLTVARYYTPTGRCIQRPYDGGVEQYERDFLQQIHGMRAGHPDSLDFPDSLRYLTPKGKVVYGGGGIMPDVYVSAETDSLLRFYNQLVNAGVIFQYAFDYTDRNRASLQRFATVNAFNEGFRVDDRLMEEMLQRAYRDGLAEDAEGLAYADSRIRDLMKAYIARNLFSEEGFYPIYLQLDPVYRKALQLLMEENGTADFVDYSRSHG